MLPDETDEEGINDEEEESVSFRHLVPLFLVVSHYFFPTG